jgi:glycopeptide antibiotics resistance protein
MVAGLLAGYLLFLLDVTLLRFPQPGPPPNWIPLATISHYGRVGGWELVRNVLGNIVLFAPLGLLVPALHAELRSAPLVIAFALCVSVAIELLQYSSGQRVADVDDVLLNTVGGVAGYIMFAQFKRRWAQSVLTLPARRPRATSGW